MAGKYDKLLDEYRESDASTSLVDVKDYGALGNGAADDTTAITSAISAAVSLGGGIVFFPAGTYLVSQLTLPSLVTLEGANKDATIIKLKDTQNADLIRTTNFGTLTGTDTTSAPYGFGIVNLTLDGNKAHNTGGNVLSIYGFGYQLERINIRNGSAWGLWSEYGSQSLPATDVAVEAKVKDFVIHDNYTGGIRFKGPHDSHFEDGVVYYNGHNQTDATAIDIVGEQFSNGTVFHNVHTWGGTYSYSYSIAATGISLRDCQIEGSTSAHVVVGASQTVIDNCKIFSIGTSINTVIGVKIINSANNLYLRAKFEDCGGGMVDFNAAGTGHSVEGFGVHYSGGTDSTAIVGAIPSNSFVRIWHLDGSGVPVDSILRFPTKSYLGDTEVTQLVSLPTSGNATIKAESATGADQAQITLTGHNASNNGDSFIMTMRTDQADVVQSVLDNSASTYHQLYEYDYLSDRVKHATNQDTWQAGAYNSPSNENNVVLAHRDDSNNATKPTWGIAFVNTSAEFAGTLGKHARIYAQRAADWGDQIDLIFASYYSGSTTEVARVANGNLTLANAASSSNHAVRKGEMDTAVAANLSKTTNDSVTDGVNYAFGTTTGTKFGTSTSQKIGFFNATPVIQQTATVDIGTAMSNIGIRAPGTSYQIATGGLVQLNGPFRINSTTLTSATTLNITTHSSVQLCNATTAAFNVTLPSTTTAGFRFIIKKIDSSANAVTVVGTIDGAVNYTLATQWKYIELISSTTSGTWYIVGNN